ncbi:ferric reductase transmembrane component 4 [Tothia fuscella]|uniref:Ferric reductase transmembrane component 4 n=1 Tax=Tothia fuscella TaxID=1048955 RepID=A0A9P4U0R0_9PEZI|nr:ferric reductase transmembrane component 4 [Tothia fuscella]
MISATLLSFTALWGTTLGHVVSMKFPGYGFQWYDPICGWGCYNVVSGAMLPCSTSDMSGHSHSMSMSKMTTSKECYASDDAWLTTIAYCMKDHCDEEKTAVWRREKFWYSIMVNDTGIVKPKWDYTTSLFNVNGTPTATYNSSAGETLNKTMLISDADYEKQANFEPIFDRLEMLQARYIFVLITVAVGTPIFLTLLGYLPYMTGILDKIKPYLVYPSTVGSYHVRPIPWLIGNAPTVGQALYIFMFFALNLILSAVNYDSAQPHPWGFAPREELLAYIGYRTGHIAYGLLPVNHNTYLLLHRWIARIFTIQAIIHSITLLEEYKGNGSFAAESQKPYWLWGIVATVLACAMIVFSVLYFRRLSYEIFLIGHIIMSVLMIVGCWYHIALMWGNNFYINWLIAAVAVWFFDRLFRVLRVAKNGVRRAVVTELGNEHVRIDIPGIRWASKPGHVGYAFFPALNPLRPWENHPFSINSTSMFHSHRHSMIPELDSTHQSSSEDGRSIDKETGRVSTRPAHGSTPLFDNSGVTLIVKKSGGLTKLLKQDARMVTLLDGPYPQNPNHGILECDHVLLIAGGIGITGILPWIHAHPNVKLIWGVKSSAESLVREMDVALRNVADKEIIMGDRVNIGEALRPETVAGYKRVGVVVCGPSAMCDDVRSMVAGIGRSSKTVFELEVDAFTW